MSLALPIRLTLFYALLLAVALCSFGSIVYTQAEQRAYHDLDAALKSRAASVRLGKDIFINSQPNPRRTTILPAVDGLGTGNIAIEVFDAQGNLLATTSNYQASSGQSSVAEVVAVPVPWDGQAIQYVSQNWKEQASIYTTLTYLDQRIRVYTIINNDFGDRHFIQTARSESDIEQSLTKLRILLVQGGFLVLVLAVSGGWFITWRIVATVHRMTTTAQHISTSQDFSQRVPEPPQKGKDEFTRLAATFNQMLASLEEAYQRQQRFVADASHELRAPITSIRCNLDLLVKATDLPQEEVHAALSDACAEASRMSRLVNDLLLLAHADSTHTRQYQPGTLQPSSESALDGYKNCDAQGHYVDLDSLLLEVFRQYRILDEHNSDGKRAQGPRVLLQHITPVRVYGNTDRLKQALIAVLDNALKYTPSEGSATLSLTTKDDYAEMKVSDTGIGIAPEDLPHIFERFYRADLARTRNRGGSGLGLAIVQSIMQEHQGSIEVESTPGKGSCFVLRLPTVLKKA